MFTQIKTNFKFIGAIFFTIFFFVGGFFMNTAKGEAATITVKSFGVSYSLSSPVSNINKDGSVSTVVLVGCAPLSGDLYDVNTGNPCNNVKTVLAGCKAGSGDIFDINTGIRCADYIKPVLVGCGIKSGDLYDINVGKRCTNDTIITTLSKTSKTKTISKITPISTTKTTVTSKAVEISPIASNLKETLPTQDNLDGISGREKIKDTLTASVAKVGSTFNGPISVWIILLVILILLGGGYGIYSLTTKDEIVETTIVKTVTQTPVTKPSPQMPHTNMPISQNPNPQITHINTSQNTNPKDGS